MATLLELIPIKYLLGGLGVLISLIVAYFKGSSAAKRSAEYDKMEAERALQSRIRSAEAKNQHLDKRGEKLNETINKSSTIDGLISMWNEIQSGKGKGGSSDKKS